MKNGELEKVGSVRSLAREVTCPRCSKRFNLSQQHNLCPCGSPLLVRYELAQAKKDLVRSAIAGRVGLKLDEYRQAILLETAPYALAMAERVRRDRDRFSEPALVFRFPN